MYFTDIATVKRMVRITNELTDSEITDFIEFTDQDIIADYGKAVKKITSTIETGRTNYYLNTEMHPGYKIDYVKCDGSLLDYSSSVGAGSSGSYGFGSGSYSDKVNISASDALFFDKKDIEISYVPQIFHNLASFMSSFDLIQTMHVVASRDGEFPRTAWMKQRIEEIKSEIQDTFIVDSQFTIKPESVDQTSIGVHR